MNISRKQKKACDFEIEWYEKISSQDKDSRRRYSIQKDEIKIFSLHSYHMVDKGKTKAN